VVLFAPKSANALLIDFIEKERALYHVKGSPRAGLTGATIGFFFGFAAVSLFGPTAKTIKDLIDLSPAEVGLLVAMPALSGSLLRIPFSAWVDKNGGRKPFLVLFAMAVIGMTGLAVILQTRFPQEMEHGIYPWLLFFGFLSGSGIATFSVGISQVSYWFPRQRQGMALGAFAGFGNLAPGIFSFLIPVFMGTLGLPNTYLAWLLFLIAGMVIYAFLGQNAPYFQALQEGASPSEAQEFATGLYTEESKRQELFPSGGFIHTLSRSATNAHTWLLVILYFTTFGGFIALTAWFPTYWQEFHATSAGRAGIFTAAFSLLASIIRVPGGSVADRIGGRLTAILSLSVLAAGAVVMTMAVSAPFAFSGAILMGVGMGINNAAVFKMVPEFIPEAIGGASGWVGGLGAFGGFVVPPVMGKFIEFEGQAGYAHGFSVFILLALVALLCAYLQKRI